MRPSYDVSTFKADRDRFASLLGESGQQYTCSRHVARGHRTVEPTEELIGEADRHGFDFIESYIDSRRAALRHSAGFEILAGGPPDPDEEKRCDLWVSNQNSITR